MPNLGLQHLRPGFGLLAAAAGAAAAHASIAAAVSGHDAAAEAAGGGVAQVDDARQGVGGVDRPRRQSLVVGRWRGAAGPVDFCDV